MGQKAFTLIEILVVVAIIAILAALLFPVASSTMKRAHLTQDVSQMRQVYVAIKLYEEDSDEGFAPSLLNVQPYAKSKAIFVSPLDPYRNGIPNVPDFPANISAYGNKQRASFRISYPYLVPMAKQALDVDDAWLRAEFQTPSLGIITMYMDNEKWGPQWFSEYDVIRWSAIMHRILMDGSFTTAHVENGVGDGCSVETCFGAHL